MSHTQQMRVVHYRREYGCTIADYDLMYAMQDGRCAMCGRVDNPRCEHFDIDHDHSTGASRGLLCNPCNTLVGQAEHLNLVDENLLEKIEKYLAGRMLLSIL